MTGDDDLFGFLAVCQEAVGEGFEQWVEDAGGHGGHEQATPEVHGADLGDGRAGPPRGAALVVLRGESGPGGELARIGEFSEVGKLGNDDLGADFSEARNALEQLAFCKELGIGLNEFGDGGAGVGELFFLHLDATFDRDCDGFLGLGLKFGFKACGVLGK